MQKKRKAILITLFAILTFLGTPAVAFADTPTFSSMLDNITSLVNTVFLPIAIIVAGWKIIYLAVFCGLMGIDPLHMVPDAYSLQWESVMTLIKYRLTGFFKGVMWIAGIWLIFNLVVGIVSVLARNIDKVL